ncbi:MAG: ABC transporter ATP-binding protein [Acidobacteria bacterium]|nr:ABC transporter ATP-binding protein [Acidobacteriota bacterium]
MSFSVANGEVVALLGPNGAGKTTTLRMLAGLITPSAGEIHVNGPVGLLTEAPGLWDRLSVRLNLRTYARLHGLSSPDVHVARVLDLVGVADRAGDPAGQLSKGLKQRAALARTLIHDPRVVLLDEPTAGLDPSSARQVRDLILAMRREGRAILVSTHNLAEAEELADRIAILRTRLLALDRSAVLRRQGPGIRVEVIVEGEAAHWVGAVRQARAAHVEASGGRLLVTLGDEQGVPDLVRALVAAGARITHVLPSDRTLEDVYLELVGEA